MNNLEIAVQNNKIDTITPFDINKLLRQFISEQNVKTNSKAVYLGGLKQYFHWIAENQLTLNLLTRAEILRYKDDLIKRGLGLNTISIYLTAVRLFYEWAEAYKIYPNIAKGIKMPSKRLKFTKQHLTVEQINQLFSYFLKKIEEATEKNKIGMIRDFAIVNLLIRTGIREMEATESNIRDITMRQGKRILKIRSKGKIEKDDFVVLTNKTYQPISAYLMLRDDTMSYTEFSTEYNDNKSPLFLSYSNFNKKGRISTRYIRDMVKGGLTAIGLTGKSYSTHSLRHSTAVMLLKESGNTESAQVVLRHANISTTQIYTESIKEELRLENPPEELLDKLF